MLALVIIATVLLANANAQGMFFGCELLTACQGDAHCIETIVYRLNLEYCLPGYSGYKLEEKRGSGKARMRNILLNSYLNRVW